MDNICKSWKDFLEIDLNKIDKTLDNDLLEYKCFSHFPPKNERFNAFTHFELDECKVVIIGQDPYHGKGEAHGLCFSVKDGVTVPPSLRNIKKELKSDLEQEFDGGDLTHWAKQGVLLLNASLSVREKSPNSHELIWKEYTNRIIKEISIRCSDVIFILWGRYAQSKKKYIDLEKHYILEANHPSPLSANRGGFFGCKHFSKSNEILEKLGKEPIMWSKK